MDNGQCCQQKKTKSKEIGGQDGPEPTRFGDWEKKVRAFSVRLIVKMLNVIKFII